MNENNLAKQGDLTQPDTKSRASVAHWNSKQYVGDNGVSPLVTGAWCEIKYLEDIGNLAIKPSTQYFSFGGENGGEEAEELGYDKFGIPDNDIYYFIEGGEDELKSMMNPDAILGEFLILSYELSYQEITTHVIEVDDQRESNGQLYVDIINECNSDLHTSVTAEISNVPGDNVPVPCFHLHFNGDQLAASFFKVGDAFVIRTETGVSFEPYRLPDGTTGFMLR